MTIPVQCPDCSQKLEAPEDLAGRRVKCPKCSAILQVPSNSDARGGTAQHEDQLAPLDDSLDELQPTSDLEDLSKPLSLDELALEPEPQLSLTDDLPTADAADISAAPTGGTTLGATKAKSQRDKRRRDLTKLLTQRWLGLLVGLVAVAVMILLSVMGHYIVGPILGLFGLAIAAREIFADRATERRARRQHENVLGGVAGGLGGLFCLFMIVTRILRGAGQASEGSDSWMGP